MANEKTMKAVALMKKAKTAADRADTYGPRIKSSIEKTVIFPLEEKVAGIDDKIYELENFNLSTDLNAGKKEMSKTACEKRFVEIMDLKYEKRLLNIELEVKKEAFVELFGE